MMPGPVSRISRTPERGGVQHVAARAAESKRSIGRVEFCDPGVRGRSGHDADGAAVGDGQQAARPHPVRHVQIGRSALNVDPLFTSPLLLPDPPV